MKTLLKWVIAIVIIIAFLKINNQYIVTTDYTLQSEKIPSSFDGFKIVQVSDLHDGLFGENNVQLIEKVEQQQPDVIFITGDLIDSNRYKPDQSLKVAENLAQIAPTYFVTGNHEVAKNHLSEWYARLKVIGVIPLKNESVLFKKDNEQIRIAGIEDALMGYDPNDLIKKVMQQSNNSYTLLLSHRPELFDIYVDNNVDAIFAGHAHGGQIRIPFVLDGMFSPGQGWMPTYTAGIYEQNETSMIVSRGLGNSGFQQRIFNLPEIVSVTLQSK